MSSPVGDSGKARIPTLKTVSVDGTRNDVSTNEEKGDVLHQLFFPEWPPGSHIPHEPLYPNRIRYSFWPSLTQLHWCISRLSPHKVLGQDSIPNVVLKESLEVITEYLLRIYWATFMLNTYSDCWREWDTIMLHKLGKPRYNVPKAYRPIALMNTMGKVLSAIVAEDLTYMCERYSLLPDNLYRGRPGRCTTNAMHMLIHRIKAAWQWHNV